MINKLEDYLKDKAPEGIALAFSGGVDSTLLLAVLGKLHQQSPFPLLAITMDGILQNQQEISEAKTLANTYGIEHKILTFNPLSIDEVRHNLVQRCYFCKKNMFGQIVSYAKSKGLMHIIDGTNADDLTVFRPGRKALQELGIISPLAELGFSKTTIRQLSQGLGLSTSSKPSVPCMATRFEYNTLLTDDKIKQVVQGENIIKRLCPNIHDLRLRVHNQLARIEVPAENFTDIFLQQKSIVNALKELGFRFITLDLEGFRSGSFDLTSDTKEK